MLNNKEVTKECSRIEKSKSFFHKMAVCLPGMPLKDINALEKKNKCVLPESLKEYFTNFGQLVIRWEKLNPEKRILSGAMQITSARNLLNNPGVSDFLNAQQMLAPRALFDSSDLDSQYGVFDHAGMGVYTLIRKKEGHFLDELYLYIAPDEFHKLTLSPVEYVEHAYAFRGMFLWQQYFISGPAANRLFPDNLDMNFSFCFPDIQHPEIAGGVFTESDATEPLIINNLAEVKASKPKGFKLKNMKFEEGTSAATLFRAGRAAGIPLPVSLEALYRFADGLEIYWEQVDISGGFKLTPLRNMMGGSDHNMINGANLQYTWNKDELFNGLVSMPAIQLPETVRYLNSWRPFMSFDYAQDQVLVRADKVSGKWILGISDFRTYFYELNVDFDLFMEVTYQLNAVNYWFWLFAEPLRRQNINGTTIVEITEQRYPAFDLNRISGSMITRDKSPVIFGS
jgi:hypothetical protein